jgi:hypothetical protein
MGSPDRFLRACAGSVAQIQGATNGERLFPVCEAPASFHPVRTKDTALRTGWRFLRVPGGHFSLVSPLLQVHAP